MRSSSQSIAHPKRSSARRSPPFLQRIRFVNFIIQESDDFCPHHLDSFLDFFLLFSVLLQKSADYVIMILERNRRMISPLERTGTMTKVRLGNLCLAAAVAGVILCAVLMRAFYMPYSGFWRTVLYNILIFSWAVSVWWRILHAQTRRWPAGRCRPDAVLAGYPPDPL